jgi:hypothetical protein
MTCPLSVHALRCVRWCCVCRSGTKAPEGSDRDCVAQQVAAGARAAGAARRQAGMAADACELVGPGQSSVAGACWLFCWEGPAVLCCCTAAAQLQWARPASSSVSTCLNCRIVHVCEPGAAVAVLLLDLGGRAGSWTRCPQSRLGLPRSCQLPFSTLVHALALCFCCIGRTWRSWEVL